MRRARVAAGVCLMAAIVAIAAVVIAGAGRTHRAERPSAEAAFRVAAVRSSGRAAPTAPQAPLGRSCFVTASPAGAAGGDECGSAQICGEFITTASSPPHRRHVLVLGSRCPPQAVLRGERAHPGLRTPRSTAR